MRNKALAPLNIALVGVVWLLLAAAVSVTVDRDAFGMRVSGRVLGSDDAPVANAELLLMHDRHMSDASGVHARLVPLRTDADGRYELALRGAGRHVVTLIVDGQSAQREVEVTRRQGRLTEADLALRNAVRYGSGPVYERYMRLTGMGLERRHHRLADIMERAKRTERPLWLPDTQRQDGRADG